MLGVSRYKLSIMKIFSIFGLQLFLLSAVYGQSSSNELGEKVFFAFKKDSINLINNYRLKIEELPAFFIANNLDTNSNQFAVYRSKYLEITRKLLSKCEAIETDTLENGLSWKNAELQKITLKDQDGNTLSVDNIKPTMLLTVNFNSNNYSFLLLMEALLGVDKLWKVGNSIMLMGGKKDVD